MSIEEWKSKIEALLFVAGEPLSAMKIAGVLQKSEVEVQEILQAMIEDYSFNNRGIMLNEIANGYQLSTKEEHHALIVNFLAPQNERFLSKASMETLSIIALRQPITRSLVEKVRGVKSEKTLNVLVERGLISELGRAEGVGRPILYGTTEKFLQCFGLKNLEEIQQWANSINETGKVSTE